MHQKKEDLEELIRENKEGMEFYKNELAKPSGNNRGNQLRYYFSNISYYRLLIEKNQKELNNLLAKFNFNSRGVVQFSLAKIGYYKKTINKINKEIKEYSEELKKFEEKYKSSFNIKDHNSPGTYDPESLKNP